MENPVRPTRPLPAPVSVGLSILVGTVTLGAALVMDWLADPPAANLIYLLESLPVMAVGFGAAICLAIVARIRGEGWQWTVPAAMGVLLLIWLILGSGFLSLIALFSSTRK